MDITTHLKKSEPAPILRTTPVLALFRKIRFSFAPPLRASLSSVFRILSSEFCVLSSFCVVLSSFRVLNSEFCVLPSSSLRGASSHAL